MSERQSLHSALPSITSAQFVRLGMLGSDLPKRRWFCSFFAEEGDPDLYAQDLDSGEMWECKPDGSAKYLGVQVIS